MLNRRVLLECALRTTCFTLGAGQAFQHWSALANEQGCKDQGCMEKGAADNLGLQTQSLSLPAFISIWKFGKAVADAALTTYQKTHSMLDAIEQGIWVAESDVENSSVGIGGTPNAEGVLQLDACIMAGPGHRAGGVAGLENIAHPISVARKVMENTKHVLLVGQGAKQFALDQGFRAVEVPIPKQRDLWRKWKDKQLEESKKPKTSQVDGQKSRGQDGLPQEHTAELNRLIADAHDTITLLGVDERGNLFGGCSTSGLAFKLPGRVGDSPIIGSGLYVDNDIGAAGATGVGENIMRFCGSFMIVELMRIGHSPQQACEAAIRRIASKDPRGLKELSINFIAINKQGQFGAAGTSPEFVYAVCNPNSSQLNKANILEA